MELNHQNIAVEVTGGWGGHHIFTALYKTGVPIDSMQMCVQRPLNTIIDCVHASVVFKLQRGLFYLVRCVRINFEMYSVIDVGKSREVLARSYSRKALFPHLLSNVSLVTTWERVSVVYDGVRHERGKASRSSAQASYRMHPCNRGVQKRV